MKLPWPALAGTLMMSFLLWRASGDPGDVVSWEPRELVRATQEPSLPAVTRPPMAARLRARASTTAASAEALPAALAGALNPLESEVMRAYELARNGRGAEAVSLVDAVLAKSPQYRPALSLQGLLAAEWTQPVADAEDERSPPRQLQPPGDLNEEAGARLSAWDNRLAHRNMVPANLLQLSEGIHTVLAADIAESRLYVFRNDANGLSLRGDYYLSTGARGYFKQNPGDQRTPVGVYSLLPRVAASELPALAGHGAWPLSFPNRWDQWQGHLGSGIWLHGSAPGQYDGLPHSTNGCLALSNDDLDRLAPELGSSGTVLLVSDRLDWTTPAIVAQRRNQAVQRLMTHSGPERALQPEDSLYAYPGAPSMLLVRRGEGSAGMQEEFWSAGAMEPLGPQRSAVRSGGAAGAL